MNSKCQILCDGFIANGHISVMVVITKLIITGDIISDNFTDKFDRFFMEIRVTTHRMIATIDSGFSLKYTFTKAVCQVQPKYSGPL